MGKGGGEEGEVETESEKERERASARPPRLLDISHPPDSPRLVLCALPPRWHDEGLDVILGKQDGDGDTSIHRKQTHGILLVLRQVVEQWHDIRL